MTHVLVILQRCLITVFSERQAHLSVKLVYAIGMFQLHSLCDMTSFPLLFQYANSEFFFPPDLRIGPRVC
jgi:hypothetical protein